MSRSEFFCRVRLVLDAQPGLATVAQIGILLQALAFAGLVLVQGPQPMTVLCLVLAWTAVLFAAARLITEVLDDDNFEWDVPEEDRS